MSELAITDVQVTLLTGPITNDPSILTARQLRSAAFIEITTDQGLVGVGETYVGYFFPEVVPVIVDFYRPILLGQDPLQIETLWERMYRCGKYWGRLGLGVAVMTGIEAALWDLKGKLLGQPVYELLGGRRHESLLAYATGAMSLWPHDALRRKVDLYLELGFRATKVGTGAYDSAARAYRPMRSRDEMVEVEAAKVGMLRQHVGADIGLMLDGHMDNQGALPTWDVETAVAVLTALEPYELLFVEEPLPYTDARGYAEVARRTSVPVAGGECLETVAEFRQWAELDALDVAQPDASFIGGLGEFMAVARLFEERGKRIATHAWGAGASVMQNVHAAFACANTLILELPPAPAGLHTEVYGDSLLLKEGRVLPPSAPGLGISLTEVVKARYPFLPGTGEFNSVPGKVMTS